MRPALQAVTWNSGMTVSETFCAGSGGASPRRSAARAEAQATERMLVRMLLWVPSAPFGLPVVPLV